MSGTVHSTPSGSHSCAGDQGRDDAIWAILLATLGLAAMLQLADPFSLSIRGMAMPLTMAIILSGVATFYRVVRPTPRIVAMVIGLQQMILFSAVGAILSYMIAARAGTPWDARIAGWDRAMGLDWRSALRWLDSHAFVAPVLKFGYQTLMPQMAALIVALALCGRLAALRIVLLAAMGAGLVIIILSGAMPAVGTYAHFGIGPQDHVHIAPAITDAHMADLLGLRDGTLRMLSLDRMQGIITFPSYHAALAAVFGWGFSRVPLWYARWPGMAMAAFTLMGTPIDGGHYFSDVAAGTAVAVIALCVARRAIRFDIVAMARIARMPVPFAGA